MKDETHDRPAADRPDAEDRYYFEHERLDCYRLSTTSIAPIRRSLCCVSTPPGSSTKSSGAERAPQLVLGRVVLAAQPLGDVEHGRVRRLCSRSRWPLARRWPLAPRIVHGP